MHKFFKYSYKNNFIATLFNYYQIFDNLSFSQTNKKEEEKFLIILVGVAQVRS